jgi:hypothetical protein
MAEDCPRCPALHAEIGRLSGQVAHLESLVAFQRRRLAELLGGVAATARFINGEIEQPSMPVRRLLPALHTRLDLLIQRAEGK